MLDMISTIYGWLGMDFALNLSTKPESALGDAAVWETAEGMIAEALDEYQAKSGRGWSLNPGDGAFYGPKIDIHVYDALKTAVPVRDGARPAAPAAGVPPRPVRRRAPLGHARSSSTSCSRSASTSST